MGKGEREMEGEGIVCMCAQMGARERGERERGLSPALSYLSSLVEF